MNKDVLKLCILTSCLFTSVGLISCSSDSTTPMPITAYALPYEVVSKIDNTKYERLEETPEGVAIKCDEEHLFGYLTNTDSTIVFEGLEAFIPADEDDTLFFDHTSEAFQNVYKIDGYTNNEYIAIRCSWFVSIYSKIS